MSHRNERTTPPDARWRARRRERGQALVIVAVAMIGLLAFIGFTVDTGIVFLGYGHLRRAVDAAALAAATQFREGASQTDLERMTRQFIAFNGVPPDTLNVQVEVCDLATQTPPELCPDPPRKFVRVRASLLIDLAFMPIIGINDFPVTAEATSEAASVDAVIVIDTSETMAKESHPSLGYGDPFDPTTCNANAGIYPNSPGDGSLGNPYKCRPLWDAKQAAKSFVQRLYEGYDQVSVITFDYKPVIHVPLTSTFGIYDITGTGAASTGVFRAIDLIPLHDDAPAPGSLSLMERIHGAMNPLNFDCNIYNPGACPGAPTENKSILSSCSGCGMRVATRILQVAARPSSLWVIIFLSDGTVNMSDVPMNCPGDPGCGTILQPDIDSAAFPNGYCAGSIGGYVPPPTITTTNPLWSQPFCVTGGFDANGDHDTDDPYPGTSVYRSEKNLPNPFVRHCGPYHPGGAITCPPGSIFVGSTGMTTTVSGTVYYDAQDYVRDWVDAAALKVNCIQFGSETCQGYPGGNSTDKYNRNERVSGGNLVIYSIGLGLAAAPPDYAGEELLRYMAAVGDDGDRVTNPCAGVPHASNCGNYYYAPSGAALIQIFEDIAKRIFTRLTR